MQANGETLEILLPPFLPSTSLGLPGLPSGQLMRLIRQARRARGTALPALLPDESESSGGQ